MIMMKMPFLHTLNIRPLHAPPNWGVWRLIRITGMVWACFNLGIPVVWASGTHQAGNHSTHESPQNVAETEDPQHVSIEFSLSSLAGQPSQETFMAGDYAQATFRITDSQTGTPVTGLHPRAWLSARHSEHVARELNCTAKVKNFLRGQLGVKADVDFNSYFMWVLNHDHTISVINPQIAFNITKLESLITLPGQGVDWALSPDKEWLYVTMPELSSVAVVHTVTRTVITTIAFKKPLRPTRIAFQPDGRFVWVGLDGSTKIAVLDTSTKTLSAMIPVEAGFHTLTFSDDGQWGFITNSAGNSVTVIDLPAQRTKHHIPVGQTPIAVAYSPLTRLAYVGTLNGDALQVLDPEQPQSVRRIPFKPGVAAVQVAPGGRFAFVLNQLESQLTVIDTTTHTIVGSTTVVKEPDQMTFTPNYAYVRGLGSEKISLIDLPSLQQGKLIPVEIQAGQNPPAASPQDIGVGSMMAPIPEGHGVMLANAPDQTIYYYMEGMMVPMGTFQTYKRKPRALLILDRMLLETQPGVYSLDIKLPHGGGFDVPILLDHPRVVQCFQITVQDAPKDPNTLSTQTLTITPVFSNETWPPRVPIPVSFQVINAATSQPVTGLKDVQILILEAPGTWHQRHWAKETEKGIYEIIQHFPHSGPYIMSVQIPSQGLAFSKTSTTKVFIRDADQLATRKESVEPSSTAAP